MRISEQWLREWVDPGLATGELAGLLTMAGLEVESVQPVAGEFSGVCVAEILAVEPHPNADRLRVCEVSGGGRGSLRVVCGAPNARAGLKAPLARVGGVLASGARVGRARLRGVESQGMLCSEAELGLSGAAADLLELPADAPVGADLRDFLELDDSVLAIELTPNRPDCLALRGVAREVGLLARAPVAEPRAPEVPARTDTEFPATLHDADACPRFVSRVITGIDIGRPSPRWLRERLRRAGLRSIDAVVDITNYVLLELGQPMHAFDFRKLRGGIVVRRARAGESLALLNGQSVALQEGTLLIADAGGPLSLAGIMGGAASAVGAATTDILLESAFFHPAALAGQARRYGLHTDASHRFERGVDHQLQRRAVERATELALAIVGGEAGPVNETVAARHLPGAPAVELRRERIERTLGLAIADDEVERILAGLGMAVEPTGAGWRARVPSWRFDLAIEADLLEELARVYGYDRLPVGPIRSALAIRPAEREVPLRDIRRRMVARGYQEAITYSFIDPAEQALFDPERSPVRVGNPIAEDMSAMRTSLLPGLLGALARNVKRQRSRVRLFETGLRFLTGEEGLRQQPAIAAMATGRRAVENWSERADETDFHDLKGDLESLLALAAGAGEFRFSACERPGFHPGQTAAVRRGGRLIGHLGALHPELLARFGLAASVYSFELCLDSIRACAPPRFAGLSRFPGTRRDLAVLVDRQVPAAELLERVRAAAGSCLADLRLFDVYAGKGIDSKRKSLALGLTFRHSSRTLDEAEVGESIRQVMDMLEKTYNAELRG